MDVQPFSQIVRPNYCAFEFPVVSYRNPSGVSFNALTAAAGIAVQALPSGGAVNYIVPAIVAEATKSKITIKTWCSWIVSDTFSGGLAAMLASLTQWGADSATPNSVISINGQPYINFLAPYSDDITFGGQVKSITFSNLLVQSAVYSNFSLPTAMFAPAAGNVHFVNLSQRLTLESYT